MARILGVVLPEDKRLEYALTLIYGVGQTRARKILEDLKIDKATRVKDLTEEQQKNIIHYVESAYKTEGDLREELNDSIKRLKDNGSYRGMRHMMGLPANGQRTKSNARTRKGKRKTVGALTKEAWAKLEEVSKRK